MMIPFRLLPLLRPYTRQVFCSLDSGSLIEGRRISLRDRLAPDSLARLFALQPLRLGLAAVVMVLLAVVTTAISIVKVEPAAVETAVASAHAQATDRIDVLDMTRWQF